MANTSEPSKGGVKAAATGAGVASLVCLMLGVAAFGWPGAKAPGNDGATQGLAATEASAATNAQDPVAFGAAVRSYLLENPEVIMEAVAVLETREAAAEARADVDLIAENRAALFDDGYSWSGGNPAGDITIVEFLDYRCGYCKRAHPDVAALMAADDNIRLVIKELPILGEESVTASRFAIAVKSLHGDETYKHASDALMAMRGSVNAASLGRIAAEFGLDMEAITAEMNADSVTQEIAETRALAQRMRISGTPSFVIGEQLLRGFLPRAGMEAIVAEQRGEG